jgi:hypothetical protein
MNHAQALVSLNGKILAVYSRRTVSALQTSLPLRLALRHLEPVLALNVTKEARKDALVIRCAGDALAAGRPPGPAAGRLLLDATKSIDREFLQRSRTLPLQLAIDYDRIAPVRLERIECLLEAAYRVLGAWVAGGGLRAAIGASYPRPELERVLHRVLRLYAIEARALGTSVRLPGMLARLREHALARLFEVMSELAAGLAADVARAVHEPARERRARACPDPH